MRHLCHPCSAKPSTVTSDSNVQQAYNRSQERRYQQLKQNVHDSLVKPPPDPPLPSQKGSCGTYILSKEEAHNDVSKYEAKMRTHRMLQVRAQEMLFASHQVEDFRNCKAKDKHQLLNYLKEIWENDQRKRIASLEEEFVTSCKSMGLSHDAAIMVQRNRGAKEELKSRQAAESRCWDALRFEEALQKERAYRKEREREAKAAEARRKQSDLVARTARTLVRPQSSPKPNETDASDDFRKTHVSSRCHVLRDRTNRHSSPSLSQPSHEDTHAWQCVDAQHGSMRACQAEVCHIHNMRKHHEERTAKACSQHDKRFYDGFRTGGPELLSHQYMLFPPDNSSFVRLKMNRPASCPGMPFRSLTCSKVKLLDRPLPIPRTWRGGTPSQTPSREGSVVERPCKSKACRMASVSSSRNPHTGGRYTISWYE